MNENNENAIDEQRTAEYEKQKYARENLTVISNVAGNPVIIEDLKFF